MLEHFFGSRTRFKLLQIFFRSPHKSFYVRELARLSGTQLNGVRRELERLESLQIIRHVEAGGSSGSETSLPRLASDGKAGTERSKYYQADETSLLFSELKALLIKAELLEEREFIEHVKKRGGQITLFVLTGFFTGVEDVDTDLLLVGNIKPQTVARLIKDYEEEIGRTVRYTILDDAEFKSRREIGDKFLYRIFEGRHLNIIDAYEIH